MCVCVAHSINRGTTAASITRSGPRCGQSCHDEDKGAFIVRPGLPDTSYPGVSFHLLRAGHPAIIKPDTKHMICVLVHDCGTEHIDRSTKNARVIDAFGAPMFGGDWWWSYQSPSRRKVGVHIPFQCFWARSLYYIPNQAKAVLGVLVVWSML